MTYKRRPTTARGLGGTHQKTRETLLRNLQDGDLCARCAARGLAHPMFRRLITWRNGKPRSPWLDLDDFPGRAFGGHQVKRLSYRSCNRSSGAVLGNRMRAAQRPARQQAYTRW